MGRVELGDDAVVLSDDERFDVGRLRSALAASMTPAARPTGSSSGRQALEELADLASQVRNHGPSVQGVLFTEDQRRAVALDHGHRPPAWINEPDQRNARGPVVIESLPNARVGVTR